MTVCFWDFFLAFLWSVLEVKLLGRVAGDRLVFDRRWPDYFSHLADSDFVGEK